MCMPTSGDEEEAAFKSSKTSRWDTARSLGRSWRQDQPLPGCLMNSMKASPQGVWLTAKWGLLTRKVLLQILYFSPSRRDLLGPDTRGKASRPTPGLMCRRLCALCWCQKPAWLCELVQYLLVQGNVPLSSQGPQCCDETPWPRATRKGFASLTCPHSPHDSSSWRA